MRNKKRIKQILKLIEKIWLENPDLRLCQLITNCFSDDGLYYIEDNILLDALLYHYGFTEQDKSALPK